MAGAVLGKVQVSHFVAGAVLGEVQVSHFVAGAVLGEVQVSHFVAGANPLLLKAQSGQLLNGL